MLQILEWLIFSFFSSLSCITFSYHWQLHLLWLRFQWLIKRHKRTLFEVLEKVKAGKTIRKLEHFSNAHDIRNRWITVTLWSVVVFAELMILGFISLLLTFSQDQIEKICVPRGVAESMLPCPLKNSEKEESTGGNKRRLLRLLLTESHLKRRILAAAGSPVECPSVSGAHCTASSKSLFVWLKIIYL